MSATERLQKEVKEQLKNGVTIVVLGASGDLAKKKTFPALYALHKKKFLPENTKIIGYARTEMNNDEFQKRATSHIDTQEDVKGFLERCEYMSGQYDQDDDWQKLNRRIDEIEGDLSKEQKNRVFYMALPPSVFVPVATGLKKHVYSQEGLTRLVIEKPFGKDTESCQELLQDIKGLFNEKEVFRIDHYLGKEMAKNIMNIRFANMMFSPLWNAEHIQSIQITLKEPFGTEGRGGYFDEFGIIRDVIQNHLLQLMSLVAMERPAKRDPESIRDEKVKLLKSVKPIKLEDSLLGQFTKNGDKPGYLDDEGVPKDSICPTFAALVLWVDNERWGNKVPFILKAGKALDNAKVEIRIQLKDLPDSIYDNAVRNELVFKLQPGEAIYMKFNSKSPGFSDDSIVTELDLTYKNRYKNLKIPEAYESLILDVMRNDHSNFVRDDELIAAWNIFTPLLHKIENEKIKPEPYLYGTRGPKNLNEFIKKYGVERSGDEDYEWPIQKIKN